MLWSVRGGTVGEGVRGGMSANADCDAVLDG